jgi:hypothetical protein
MLRGDEIRIDVGRCDGGTFLRIVHVPTRVSRSKAPLGGEPSSEVRSRLLAEIEGELVRRGLSQYIVRGSNLRPAQCEA